MTYYPPISPLRAGVRGVCPRCGEGALFTGYLNVRPSCDRCGLSFEAADSGDGPAVFIIMIVGFLIVGGALFVEVAHQPPIWVHIAIWFPLTALLVGLMLRPMKGTMIALQYQNQAAEGRLEE